VDPANNVTTTKSETVGKNFELSALISAGGPESRWPATRSTVREVRAARARHGASVACPA
jgi:hypothetical protein